MKNLASRFTQAFPRWNALILAMAAVVGLALGCPCAKAQSGAGSIQGTVQDATHAVIPGASITVVNTATNVSLTTKSNGVGFYQVPGLFTGNYAVTVTAPNMKTYKTSIQLLVAQNGIINPVMTAGAVTQQVEVAASNVQLTTTDNGTISSTLENARINQLPMNGRSILTLTSETTPGLEGGGRANGLMSEALEFVADGVPLTNRQFGGTSSVASAMLPDPDSVQEVRVDSSTSAQYTEPGTVVVTTKSGTNQLHGALFETARNNAIGIAKARQNPSNFAAPHYVRNEFGLSAGGPIVLPKVYHGKDKSFWFLSYERYSLSSASSELVTVPTPAMRQGDFSGLTNSAGLLQALYDPSTTQASANCAANDTAKSPVTPNPYCRTQFPNNQIPIGRISPTMKIINDITPLPNLGENPLVHANLQAVNPNFTVVPTWTFRLDHAFNENNRAYLRYTSVLQVNHSLRNYPSNTPASIAADGFPDQASGMTYNPAATFAGAVGFTHVFSPTFFSETILSNQWFSQHNYAGGTPLANFEAKLGLPNNFGEPGFPNFGSNLITPYGGTQFIYGLSQIVTNLDENLTKTVGKHQMLFGGRYRHERFGDLPDESADTVSFSSQATGVYDTTTTKNYGNLANTGNVNGDAFLGAASGYSVHLQPAYEHFHDMEFDAYYQDNYHVSRALTLNLGLRWEAHPAPWMKGGTANTFDIKNDALVYASTPAQLIAKGFTTQAIVTNTQNIGVKYETPGQAGLPDKLMRDYNLNFSPRVGIAYQPFGGKYGTVLRGAYGRYIYPVPTRSAVAQEQRQTPLTAAYSISYTAANQSPDGIQNYLLRHPQPVIMGVNSSNVVDSTSTTALLPGLGYTFASPVMPPDFVTEANFTVEQPLKGNSVLRVTYLYTHGTNLDQQFYFNAHPSTFTWEVQTGTVTPTGSTIGQSDYAATGTGPYDKVTWGSGMTEIQKTGFSNDNALQVNYQRLYHRGVAYQISYVWSKPFRVGGNTFRDAEIQTAAAYGDSGIGTWQIPTGSVGTVGPYRMPPARPAGVAPYGFWRGLNRWANYSVDPAIPFHHVNFNGIYDLPFGRGKRFLGNANRFLNEIVGGFQLAGDGSVVSQTLMLTQATSTSTPTVDWGPINPLKTYKHKAKITDCTSGVCLPAYEWFNGYWAPSVVNSTCNGISGLPSDWQPYQQPIDTNYNPTAACGKAQDPNYNTNNIQVNLANGTTSKTGFAPNGSLTEALFSSSPWAHAYIRGPFNYTIDLSMFKVFPITESTSLRFNVDAFNALNMQGYNNPSSITGEQLLTSSHNTPRQLQFTLRLQF